MDLKEQIKQELEKKRAEAAKTWHAFDEARNAAKAEGVNLGEDGEAFKKLDDLNAAYSAAADAQKHLEQRLVRMYEMEGSEAPDEPKPTDGGGSGGGDGAKAEQQTPGDRFISSAGYKSVLESGVLNITGAPVKLAPVKTMTRTELKAVITGLSDTSSGAFIINQRLPGFFEFLQRQPRVAQLVTSVTTNVDIVEWVRETAFTNAAAEVAEATSVADGLKPESSLALVVESSPVQQIAHYMNVTRRALADATQISDLINSELNRGIQLRLDNQIVNGNGTAPNLRGILNTSGIATQAKGADSRADAVRKAITTIRLAFLEPGQVLMHPTDVQSLVLEKNTNADYYYGSPGGPVAGMPQLWGLPIVESPVIAQGTALVGDFRQVYLFVRDGISVLTSENVNDNFLRNIITLLGEARFGLGVPRPAAFTQVTGL